MIGWETKLWPPAHVTSSEISSPFLVNSSILCFSPVFGPSTDLPSGPCQTGPLVPGNKPHASMQSASGIPLPTAKTYLTTACKECTDYLALPSVSSCLSCWPVRRKYFLNTMKIMARGVAARNMYGRTMDTTRIHPTTTKVNCWKKSKKSIDSMFCIFERKEYFCSARWTFWWNIFIFEKKN